MIWSVVWLCLGALVGWLARGWLGPKDDTDD